MSTIARLEAAKKVYKTGDTTVVALDATSLEIKTGEVLLVIGPSGSGKTTLLSLLGCVIYPTEGRVIIDDIETTSLSDRQMAAVRLKYIGFVFQSFNLIAPLTAEENVAFPLQLTGHYSRRKSLKLAREALSKVGMLDKRHSLPRQLSGGQQQRVAIARALVTSPALLLCDEPTAALDVKSVDKVMSELQAIANDDRSVVIVTHDHRLEPYADRIIGVENGKVQEIQRT